MGLFSESVESGAIGCELSIAAVHACCVQTVDCLGLQCLMWPHPLSLLWAALHQQSLHPAPETSKNTCTLKTIQSV